jgi:hypothetical protein
LAQEAGALAIWVVEQNIPVGDHDRYSAGWAILTDDQRNRYRNMARACIVAADQIRKQARS